MTSGFPVSDALREAVESIFVGHIHQNVDKDGLFRMISEDENGHAEQAGWHFGWTWSKGGAQLNFLCEHRHPGMSAYCFLIDPADGSVEVIDIDAPSGIRPCSSDPEEDARLEAEHIERMTKRYDDLRERGLLPPFGENLPSQDINEYLITGREE